MDEYVWIVCDQPLNVLGVFDSEEAARAHTAAPLRLPVLTEIDPVEEVAQDHAAGYLISEHRRTCPIWARRKHNPNISECDCWVLPQARLDAATIIAAYLERTE